MISTKGTAKSEGSSPRVRGKPGVANRVVATPGLIPACAGKTAAVFELCAEDRAHPRVCGENRLGKITMPYEEGSSPRVRGKPVRGHGSRVKARLIPACAGKTLSTA